jgi:hypothetical protein
VPSALDRPLLLVLGMHRSGTSALSGLLVAGGATLPRNLLTANEHNPRGFFESGKIVWINGARLHGGGSAWDDPLLYPAPSWPPAEDAHWRGLAREVFETEFGDATWPLMKDPRLSVVLPAWRPAFAELGLRAGCVICVRNPAAVAASLVRRDGFSAEKALLLWASYMVAAVMNTHDLPRVFVGYDALLADWRGELGRIAAALGCPSPARDPAAAAQADSFLTPELRHNPGGGDLRRYGWVGELATQVHGALLAALSGGALDSDALERAAALIAAKRREFGPIVASISRDLDMARNEAARLRLAAGSGTAAA